MTIPVLPLFLFSSLVTLSPFATLSALPYSQNPTEALINENRALAREAEDIEDLYDLKGDETWHDITDKVLESPDTPEISKQAIRDNHRRIIVFKYLSDGLWVKGFISFTPRPEYHPLLILYRWGNKKFALMNPGVSFATYKNYTVISSTLRGGVSEGNDEFGGKDVDDMKNLIVAIPQLTHDIGIKVNPPCVFMLGPSRGGMEMFLTLAHFPELQKRVNKVVALSAILDMNQMVKERPHDMKVMFQNQFGLQSGPKEREWIDKRDPIQTVNSISRSIPILVVQGTNDNRIGLSQGHNMVAALQDSGHEVNYWEVKGGDHVLMNHPFIMNDIAQWLESNSPCMSITLAKEKAANNTEHYD